MIEKNSDLKKEDILKLFLYYKLQSKNFHNFITKSDYDNFILTEQLIDEFNSNFLENNFITNNWINHYNKVVSFFYSNIFYPKVLVWSDREKNNYYLESLQKGFEFENYICQFFKSKYSFNIETYKTKEGQYNLGESIQGIEIKNDTLIPKTGNIYIELQEKKDSSQKNWINSGILKNDNTLFYLIGTEEKFYIFLKTDLLKFYENNMYFKLKEIKTSRGMLLKVKDVKDFSYSPEEMIAYINNRY